MYNFTSVTLSLLVFWITSFNQVLFHIKMVLADDGQTIQNKATRVRRAKRGAKNFKSGLKLFMIKDLEFFADAENELLE